MQFTKEELKAAKKRVELADIAQKFQAIPEVSKVNVEMDEENSSATISFLVYLPQYNYDLMHRIVGLEYDSYHLAKQRGLELEFKYLPAPYATEEDLKTFDFEPGP